MILQIYITKNSSYERSDITAKSYQLVLYFYKTKMQLKLYKMIELAKLE